MRCTISVAADEAPALAPEAGGGPAGGWDVTLTIDGVEVAAHRMAAVAGPPGVGPDAAPPGTEAGAAERAEIAGRLRGGRPQEGDVERMGRYLFDSLLGATAWGNVRKEATRRGERLIELALAWRRDAVLDRLHWELMHDGAAFLAGHPEFVVAITRLVLDAATPEPDPVKAPVRVLFVIGSHLADPRIRAGAEIMGLLRRAERGRGAINPRVIEWTTLSKLETAVRRHGPHVVHLISHGEVTGDRGQVLLRREGSQEDDEDAVALVDADALLMALRDAHGHLPPLVVITACQSGAGAGDHTAPLAAELVAGGVPAVVGMTGRVSDMACRLFTERFGAVLTSGGRLIGAMSAGRRAALKENGAPGHGMNWALPALFLAPDVGTDFAPVDASATQAIFERLTKFKLDDDPVFCGRRAHLMAFDELLDPGASLRVLAAYTERPVAGIGKRRLLHEFGWRAMREGHVIVFLQEGAKVKVPTSAGKLAARLAEEIHRTRTKLELPVDPGSVLLYQLAAAAGDGPDLAGAAEALRRSMLTQFLAGFDGAMDMGTLRDALAPDLAALARDARTHLRPSIAEEVQVVLLLENVEAWDVDPQELFDMLHDLSDQQRVPVALTCTLKDTHREDLDDVRKRSLGGGAVKFLELEPFTGDDESLAYQWVLLNPRPLRCPPVSRHVYAVKDPLDERWLEGYRVFVKGLPGNIDSELFYATTSGLTSGNDPVLITGNDEDVLARLLREQEP